tara:strand:- start:980 stop:1429 length:450 start_codon:yes stop_codon:yes gene_type:complete
MKAKVITKNRKALYDYEILEKYEAGIVLSGTEIKSIRQGRINIKQAYIGFFKKELFIIGMNIPEYSNSGYVSHFPDQNRKLLLHKLELKKIKQHVEEKGKTIIPLSIYFKGKFVKVEFGIAVGKKKWDKRRDKIEKDVNRQLERALKKR